MILVWHLTRGAHTDAFDYWCGVLSVIVIMLLQNKSIKVRRVL